jgi:hypothetical protein
MYRCIDVSMYLCIYVSMYLCIYVFMSLCLYVSVNRCIDVSMYVCMYFKLVSNPFEAEILEKNLVAGMLYIIAQRVPPLFSPKLQLCICPFFPWSKTNIFMHMPVFCCLWVYPTVCNLGLFSICIPTYTSCHLSYIYLHVLVNSQTDWNIIHRLWKKWSKRKNISLCSEWGI